MIAQLQIDKRNNIGFERRNFNITNFNIRSGQAIKTPSIAMDELLNCHRKFRDPREVKGIFYEKESDFFYIFINRFFLKIEEDLVRTGFRIDDRHYAKAYDLKFSSNYEFEIARTKWVKTLKQKSYLVTNKRNVFELNHDSMVKNYFTADEGYNQIEKCAHQTLNIGKHVFCFDKQYYHYFMTNGDLVNSSTYRPARFKISNIFQDSSIHYRDDEELNFIFNYNQDKFVIMMTKTRLFVIDYSKFTTSNDWQIQLNYKPNEQVLVIKNYLFESYAPEESLVNLRSILSLFLISIVISIAILIVLIYKNNTYNFRTKLHQQLDMAYAKLPDRWRKMESKEYIVTAKDRLDDISATKKRSSSRRSLRKSSSRRSRSRSRSKRKHKSKSKKNSRNSKTSLDSSDNRPHIKTEVEQQNSLL